MEYGAILRKAWEITWKNKALWILGILASCGRGGGSGASGNYSNYRVESGEFGRMGQEFERFIEKLSGDETFWLVLAGAVILILILSLLFYALGVIGQGGLIAAFHKSDQGTIVGLSQAFQAGLGYFWRLLGAQVLIGLVILAIILLLTIPTVGLAIFTLGLGILCLLPVFFLLALAAGVYVQFVQMGIVVEGLGVTASMRRAWDVIRANLGPVLLMSVILILGALVVSGVIALPFLAAVLPLITGALVGGDAARAGIGLAAVCLIGYLPILILLQGILTTYVSGSWTLTYLRLIERPGTGVEGTP
jgi:hypothetical protein